MKTTLFRFAKAQFPIESIALNTLLQNEKHLTPEDLRPKHKKHEFVWETTEATPWAIVLEPQSLEIAEDHKKPADKKIIDETEWNDTQITISKGLCPEKEAVQLAMLTLNTFEGNLRAQHTENHFVFEKIRG